MPASREHDRMLVVVAEHERPDAQRLGDGGGVHERDSRRELVIDEVIGHEQRRDPGAFGRRASSVKSFADAVSSAIKSEAELAVVGTASQCHGVVTARSVVTGRAPAVDAAIRGVE